jgi:integrase
LQREYEGSAYVFMTERGGLMSPDGIRKVIRRAGEQAGLGFPIHPHMLRHSCGYKLANDGHDTRAIQHYLGHKNIQHTVRYTELAPARFKKKLQPNRKFRRNLVSTIALATCSAPRNKSFLSGGRVTNFFCGGLPCATF